MAETEVGRWRVLGITITQFKGDELMTDSVSKKPAEGRSVDGREQCVQTRKGFVQGRENVARVQDSRAV